MVEVDMDILDMHLREYELEFSIGTIKLKALSQLDFERTHFELEGSQPEYAELIKEMLYLQDIQEFPDGLSAEQMARLAHLNRKISDWSDWFMLECFVAPPITHPDHLRALSSELEPEEWRYLDQLLGALTNPLPADQLQQILGAICLEFGVPLAEGMTAENITVQQVDVLKQAGSLKARAIWEEIGRGAGPDTDG